MNVKRLVRSFARRYAVAVKTQRGLVALNERRPELLSLLSEGAARGEARVYKDAIRTILLREKYRE